MSGELWRVHKRTQFVVSSIGKIKKSSGKETFGTLRRNKYYVKKNGVRECVGRMVLEAHAPNRRGNYQGKGVVVWGTPIGWDKTKKNGDTQNNNITNLYWAEHGDGWRPGQLEYAVARRINQYAAIGREVKAGRVKTATTPAILASDAYNHPENFPTWDEFDAKYPPEVVEKLDRQNEE